MSLIISTYISRAYQGNSNLKFLLSLSTYINITQDNSSLVLMVPLNLIHIY